MRLLYAIFILSLLLISCDNQKINDSRIDIDIDVPHKRNSINIDKLLDNTGHKLIKLESSQPVGTVSKFKVKNDTIYFISQHILYIFDINGNYISKIDKRGRSRKEYIELTNYTLGTDCVYILDNASMKINSYNYNGDYIANIDISKYWANDIFFFNSHLYLINRSSDSSKGKYRIFKLDLNGNLIEKYLPFDGEFADTNDGNSYMRNNTNTVSLCIAPNNTIYDINNKSCKGRINLNFTDKNLPVKYYRYNLRQLISEGIVKKYVLGVENLQGNSRFTFVDYWFNNSLSHVIFDHNNDVIGIGDYIEIDKYYNIDANNYYVFDDYLYIIMDANIFKIVTELVVAEKRDKNNHYLQEIEELSARTINSDNPIIIVYKLINE